MWAKKAEFDALGIKVCIGVIPMVFHCYHPRQHTHTQMVCIVHQAMPAEIKAFAEGFWSPEALYLDREKTLYKLIHGKVKKGGILSMFNLKVWSRIRAASKIVKDHNLTGIALCCVCMMCGTTDTPTYITSLTAHTQVAFVIHHYQLHHQVMAQHWAVF